MEQNRARFAIGDVSRPPKDAPWYHVIVQDSDSLRYVAEQNLAPDVSGLPVRNPALEHLFDEFVDGSYVRSVRVN